MAIITKNSKYLDRKFSVSCWDVKEGGRTLTIIEHSSLEDIIFNMYSRSTTYKDLNELARNAKIEKHITFHVSRISFVTLSVSAGISIFVISKLCGHTNIKTTQIYTRMTDMTYMNAIKSLDNLFVGNKLYL